MRKPLVVNEEALKTAIENAKNAQNRGTAIRAIRDEYVAKTGRMVCSMWVRRRLVDLGLLDATVRSKRGRKMKVAAAETAQEAAPAA